MENKVIVIGLGHKMFCGKDTVAAHWKEKFGVIPVSFAYKLKAIVKDLYGLTEEHTNGKLKQEPILELGGITPRTIMQKFGTNNREIYDKVWVEYLFRSVISSFPSGTIVAIPDCRFPNEAEYIKNKKGYVVKVNRDTSNFSISAEQRAHPSETSLDSYGFDFVIDNNGSLEELYEKADAVLSNIISLSRGNGIEYGKTSQSSPGFQESFFFGI